MKNIWFQLAVTCIAVFIPVSSPAVDSDKALHFGVSAALGGLSESVLYYKTGLKESERIVYGTLLGSAPGLAKELYDEGQSDNSFSESDMVANVLGAFVGSLVSNFLHDHIHVNVARQGHKTTVALSCAF